MYSSALLTLFLEHPVYLQVSILDYEVVFTIGSLQTPFLIPILSQDLPGSPILVAGCLFL